MNPHAEVIALLKSAAIEASGNAYSPYSKFRVGAAVIDQHGTVYAGCNIENASYGLTQCAERNAISAAMSNGSPAGSLLSLLIYTQGDRVFPPCGACRQVMCELMAEESQVISCCDGDKFMIWARHELLPDPFDHREHKNQPG
jgi:cytidine deaminase